MRAVVGDRGGPEERATSGHVGLRQDLAPGGDASVAVELRAPAPLPVVAAPASVVPVRGEGPVDAAGIPLGRLGAERDGAGPHPAGRRAGARWWHRARAAVSLGLLAAAIAIMVLQFGEVESAARRLSRLDPAWVALAVGAEGGSMLTLGRLQQRLLRAGGADVPLHTMASITLAGDALSGTLPGGVAWSAAWLFDQLGRRGVERFLRVWVFLVAGGVSSFALFLVVATGVETAGSEGPVSSLRWLVFLLALIPLTALGVEVFRDRRAVRRLLDRVEGADRDRGPVRRRLVAGAATLTDRVTAVRLGRRGWLEVLALAVTNWLLDCLVVVGAMEALGVSVPWRAILVVYGLTQIAASIPLTPGGIGVVAGSLAALLHAYGVPLESALAVVILYRIISFWAVVPVGWATWGVLEWTTRHRAAAA